MTVTTLGEGAPSTPGPAKLILSLGAALAVLVAVTMVSRLVPAAAEYPAWAESPAAAWISAFFLWLQLAISGLTRRFAAIMALPLELAIGPVVTRLQPPTG